MKKTLLFIGSVVLVLIIAGIPIWRGLYERKFGRKLIEYFHYYGKVTGMEKIVQKIPTETGEAVLVHYLLTVDDSVQFRLYERETSKDELEALTAKVQDSCKLHFHGFEQRFSQSFFAIEISTDSGVIVKQERFD
jgi:hypothetical protein